MLAVTRFANNEKSNDLGGGVRIAAKKSKDDMIKLKFPWSQFVIATAIVSFAQVSQTWAESGLSATGLVERTIEANVWRRNCHLKLDITGERIVRGANMKAPQVNSYEWNVDIFQRDDDLHVVKQNKATDGIEEPRLELLVTNGRRIMWQKGSVVQYSESAKFIQDARSFDRASSIFGYYLDCAVPEDLFGAFDLPVMLANAAPDRPVSDEKVGDLDCKRVTLKGDGWVTNIWIAPERSYNFAKYTIDLTWTPTAKRAERHVVVDGIKFQQQKDGSWIIAGGHSRDTLPDVPEAGRTLQVDLEMVRTTIDLSPDFTKAFEVPNIPNGEAAEIGTVNEKGESNQYQSGIKYMWKDGKVVPAYDPKTIDRIKGLSQPEGRAK